MPTPSMTEEEIISYLRKTSLPTLLVEGAGDAGIFRWLENETGVPPGSVLPCSGRETLISIYRKRDTFPHGKLAWLADRDMWRFTRPPSDLSGMIFTTGYSIENDLYAGSEIESLLDPEERTRHAQLINVVCQWFAFEVIEFEAGRDPIFDVHVRRFVDFNSMGISALYRAERGYYDPPADKVNGLLKNYKLDLRGKQLLQALVELLNGPKRDPKYSHSAIVEMCVKLYKDSEYINRLVDSVKEQMA